jgi:glutamine synthetase
MSPFRQQNVMASQWSPNGLSMGLKDLTSPDNQIYGENVFSSAVQRQRLPKDVFKKLSQTLSKNVPLDATVADSVALAMKEWALEKGCTHYSHVFQPLTGLTAEKHDSFYGPTGEGTALASFTGKELIQAEPDASSFPNGGIRSTFEARGYTAWDPSSPAFILENPNGALLCIPTGFVSWSGEALDSKIPLLRSMEVMSKSAVRALRLFGNTSASHIFTSVGPEQEYFLIDEQYYFERPDLIATGRTLFGAQPPKGQELDDHYFGSIPERVLAYMMDCENELAKLGIPIKTRHNEVAPSQYEIAPIYENSNVGVDHQQLTMSVLQKTARRYGLVCLLHEKPFQGVNGSGKHNNWSMATDDGENLMNPGDTPGENWQFLFFCTAVIEAVNKHAGLLRATVASAAQDHRLGANEAPPAIISIFLGAELQKAFDALEKGKAAKSIPQSFLGLGTPVLPTLPLDGGDRNRTSPFAFTGNKFEFRAPGSGQSLGLVNTVLNTIVAESVDELSDELEAALSKRGAKIEVVLPPILQKHYVDHKIVIFNGDGYSDKWPKEAAKRGLKNLRTTPEALPELVTPEAIALLSKYGVLSEREIEARYEVFLEQYVTKLNIEAESTSSIARTMLLPASIRYLSELTGAEMGEMTSELRSKVDEFYYAITKLEEANLEENHPTSEDLLDHAKYFHDTVVTAMGDVRVIADELEKLTADDLWPLPKYEEILFIK